MSESYSSTDGGATRARSRFGRKDFSGDNIKSTARNVEILWRQISYIPARRFPSRIHPLDDPSRLERRATEEIRTEARKIFRIE